MRRHVDPRDHVYLAIEFIGVEGVPRHSEHKKKVRDCRVVNWRPEIYRQNISDRLIEHATTLCVLFILR